MSPDHVVIAVPGNGSTIIPWNAARRAEALAKHYRVTIVSGGFPPCLPSSIGRVQVPVPDLRVLRRFCHVPNDVCFALGVRRAVSSLHERTPASFVLCHGYSLTYFVGRHLRRAAGVPFGMVMHGHIFERPKGTYDARVTAYYRAIAPACYREADLLVALSPDLARWAGTRGVKAERVVVAPNGLDLGDLGLRQPLPERRPLAGKDGPLRLLYVGRSGVEKGVGVLLDACARLRERGVPFRIVLVGADSGAAGTRRKLAERSIEGATEIAGNLPRRVLGERYLDADVLCVPSISEPFGNVALEGLATGTLVVASRVGGLCSMIEDGMNGLLVEPGSPEALAAALERVHDDPAWASGIRERAAASVEGRFDWPAIGERIHAGIERARAARA